MISTANDNVQLIMYNDIRTSLAGLILILAVFTTQFIIIYHYIIITSIFICNPPKYCVVTPAKLTTSYEIKVTIKIEKLKKNW